MDRPPPVIPDYELLRRIGLGSYGEVWLARSVTGLHRAVKVIYRARFEDDRPYEREFAGVKRFEPISRLNDSQVDIFHVGRNDTGGYFYYVMELADPVGDGTPAPDAPVPESYTPKTLKAVLAARHRLPVKETLPIAISLADALAHLHAHGLAHRDIKPSNIIFVNGRPKLADIGLIAATDATRSFVGTEGFVPREGPGTPQADVFSLGKVLYEVCTGRDRLDFPSLPENLETLPDRTELHELNEILLKACDPDPGHCYASAAELRGDLLLLQAGKSVRRLRALERRARAALPALGTLFAVALIVVGFQYLQTREARLAASFEALRRREAQEQHLATRQLLYAANLSLTQQALDAGDLGRARDLLSEFIPRGGEPDLRGWEWRWFSQQTRGEQLFAFTGHSNAVKRVSVSPDGFGTLRDNASCRAGGQKLTRRKLPSRRTARR